MAKSKAIEKQPYEAFPIYGNFSAVMEETETIDIANSTVIITDKNNAIDTTMIDTPTLNADGFKLIVRIQNGDPNLSPYKVSFRITTSLGNRWEIDAALEVVEK